MIDSAEDEAFNEIERQSLWRKQAVLQAIRNENERLVLYNSHDLNPYRSQVIEEVAQAVLKIKGFPSDTLHSFAIYIRGLK
jgi:phage terminase Nu1 subunit (DNA packaging protein)